MAAAQENEIIEKCNCNKLYFYKRYRKMAHNSNYRV